MVFNYIFQGFWRVVHMLPIGTVIAFIIALYKYKTVWKKETIFFTVLSTYMLGLFDITGMFLGNSFEVSELIESLTKIDIPFKNANCEMLILNLLLFVPVGLLFSFIFESKKYVVLILCSSISIVIEFVQGFIGRFLEIDDIIMNTLGGALGVFLFIAIRKIKIYFPTKTEIIMLFLSIIIFLNATVLMDNYLKNDDYNLSDKYISVYDEYDSEDSTVNRLYKQKDSLNRLINCYKDEEKLFGDKMYIYSHQQLDFEDGRDCIEIVSIEKNTYQKANIKSIICQGSDITNFQYSDKSCPILLPNNMKKHYSLGDEFDAYYLGYIKMHFIVNGFIEETMVNISDEAVDFSECAVMPLFENIEDSDLDDLGKKIILTQMIEPTIEYENEIDKVQILNNIEEISKKYNLELITLDMLNGNKNNFIEIPTFVYAVSFCILIIMYLFVIYRKNLWCNVDYKISLINMAFWEVIVGFGYIFVKIGIYDSGNAVFATAISIILLLFMDLITKYCVRS